MHDALTSLQSCTFPPVPSGLLGERGAHQLVLCRNGQLQGQLLQAAAEAGSAGARACQGRCTAARQGPSLLAGCRHVHSQLHSSCSCPQVGCHQVQGRLLALQQGLGGHYAEAVPSQEQQLPCPAPEAPLSIIMAWRLLS